MNLHAPTRIDRDHDLLDALRRREPMAAQRLVSTYGERAYRPASRITGNGEGAQEVVQDAFWTVIRKIDSSAVSRHSGRGSNASWPMLPIRRFVVGRAAVRRSRWTRCSRCSTSAVATPRR